MSDILERICQDKRAHVAACRANRSLESLTAAAKDTSPPRGFAARLSAAVEGGRYGLICEIKKASPSKGLICEDFAPASLASGYEAGGAACLSVLKALMRLLIAFLKFLREHGCFCLRRLNSRSVRLRKAFLLASKQQATCDYELTE